MLSVYNNIKAKRYELGWTQADLAEKMGYKDKSTITKIETGVNDITTSTLMKFAEVFGCTAGELMGIDGTTEERDQDEATLLELSRKLNREAMKNLIEYTKFLCMNDNNRGEYYNE